MTCVIGVKIALIKTMIKKSFDRAAKNKVLEFVEYSAGVGCSQAEAYWVGMRIIKRMGAGV